jgi:hypothetical protein
METDRELKTDAGIIVLMILYGIVIVRSSPISAIAAWTIGGLLLLRHTVEPFGDFVEEHQLLFLLAMLAILTVGFLLSRM